MHIRNDLPQYLTVELIKSSNHKVKKNLGKFV